MIPSEQQRPDIVERRINFVIARRFVPIESLVFLDESGAQTNMTRRYGWAQKSERCYDHTPHGHWKTTTMLSAIRLDGVVEQATVLLDGPMTGSTFLSYTQQCLAPSLRSGDVLIMDNLSSHKMHGVADAIESVDASLWYLPAYSPDLNPIEKLWSKVKAWLRRIEAKNFQALWHAVADALKHVTKQECNHYFASCGYGD